jgi:hypothetical protein
MVAQVRAVDAVTVSAGNATGSPGDTVTVAISLDNDVGVRALQFRLTDIPDVLDLVANRTTARSAALVAGANEQPDGSVLVVLLSIGSALIAPGTGPVMELDFTIDAAACPGGGTVTLHLSEVQVADANRNPLPVITQDGSVVIVCAPVSPTPTPTATPRPVCTQGSCVLDVDCRNGFDVATDAVYIARLALGLPPVPASFRAIDPSIPPDSEIAARIDALCP